MSLTLFQIPMNIAVRTDFMQTGKRKRSKKAKDFSVSLFCKDATASAVSVPVVIWEKSTSFIFERNILSRLHEMLVQ